MTTHKKQDSRPVRGLPVLVILYLLLLAAPSQAQVAISTNGATPHPSAMLDLNVSALPANAKRGFLIPRMTSAERIALPAPATGAMVYDTTTQAYWYFNGTVWVRCITTPHWDILGNAGLTAGTHFIGTIDNVPLEFRVNGERAGWLSFASTNTAWGYRAMPSTTGVANTAVGAEALVANIAGSYNTAVGVRTMAANISGSRNTAIGNEALSTSTTVSETVAIGLQALLMNTTGSQNTAVGEGSMTNNSTGGSNTALGYRSLNAMTIGSRNTVFGVNCGADATTASDNTIVSLTGDNLTTGTQNTMIMGALGTGSRNTCMLGPSQPYVSNNTAFGVQALSGGGTDNNTAVGMQALSANGSGSGNSAVGWQSSMSGYRFHGTSIGAQSATSNASTGATAIGAQSIAGGSTIRFGSIANNGLIGGFGAWQNLSDARFKNNVQNDVPGLKFILALRPVSYTLDAAAHDRHIGLSQLMDSADAEQRAEYEHRVHKTSTPRHIGFIAQEVELAARSIGYDFSGVHSPVDEHDHYTIGYEQFVVPLVKAVQEQQEQLDTMRDELNAAMLRVELLNADMRDGAVLPGTPPHPSANSQRP